MCVLKDLMNIIRIQQIRFWDMLSLYLINYSINFVYFDLFNNQFTMEDLTDNLFVHEYGHYIQTQQMGFWFFPIVALPSIASAAFTSKWSGMEHPDRWFEVDASNKGAKYFDKHYGSGKAGYTKGSENYFDIDSFRGRPLNFSPYRNVRTGEREQDKVFPNTKGRVVIWDFIL